MAKADFIAWVDTAVASVPMNEEAEAYFNQLKARKQKEKPELSEKAVAVLTAMQEEPDKAYTAADLVEITGISSGRSVSGTVRGLVTKELAEKVEGSDPVAYILTEAGKAKVVEA